MQTLKTTLLSIIIGITLAGGITYAAVIWNGTAWITNGSIISATSLKQNLDYLKEQVSAGGLWSTNGANVYYNTGNVGIGTTSPGSGYKLHVNGAIRTQGNFTLSNSTGSKIYPYYFSATNHNWMGAESDGSISFGTGTTAPAERMRIDNAGNVGIGTTSPSNKLEVAGKIEADAYCDRNGQNCKTAAQMGRSTSGTIVTAGCNNSNSGIYATCWGGAAMVKSNPRWNIYNVPFCPNGGTVIPTSYSITSGGNGSLGGENNAAVMGAQIASFVCI